MAEKTYHTEMFAGTIQTAQMYVVIEDETKTAIAYCPSLDDAERVKALLVYYGDSFKPSERPKVRMDAEPTPGTAPIALPRSASIFGAFCPECGERNGHKNGCDFRS